MKMQMLVVVAVAALVSSLSEGRILTKCELKRQLEAAALQLPEKAKEKVSEEDFIAKIVCHVEKSTGFNTSVVTQLSPDAGPPLPRRGKRSSGKFKLAQYGNKFRGGKGSSEEDSGSHEGSDSTSGEALQTVWNLYGVFQLSDHVICASGSDPTPNLCQMDCSNLIDDDISDDINCVEEIKITLESGPGEHNEALKRMFMLLFQKECYTTVASEYFAEC